MAPQEQTQAPELPPRIPIVHNAALAGTVLIPLVMLLPPRRLDVRFIILTGCLSLSTNQLCYEYTGQSLYARFGGRMSSTFSSGMPEGAQRTQRIIREHREREAAAAQAAAQKEGRVLPPDTSAQAESGLRDTVRNVWMGSEGEDWREKRLEEHRQALDEGKGFSGIIMDQIAEVWGGKDPANKKSNANDNAGAKVDELGRTRR